MAVVHSTEPSLHVRTYTMAVVHSTEPSLHVRYVRFSVNAPQRCWRYGQRLVAKSSLIALLAVYCMFKFHESKPPCVP